MRNRKAIAFLVIVVLVGTFAIWRGIALHQRRAAVSPPTVTREDILLDTMRSLPGGETLTDEDTKALAKVVDENPLPSDAESLTEEDTKFLLESEAIDEEEVELLLRLEKILRRELR